MSELRLWWLVFVHGIDNQIRAFAFLWLRSIAIVCRHPTCFFFLFFFFGEKMGSDLQFNYHQVASCLSGIDIAIWAVIQTEYLGIYTMALTYLVRASFPLSPSLFLVKLNLFVATEWREWTKRTALVVSIGSRANNEIMSVSKLAHLCSLSLVGYLYEIT